MKAILLGNAGAGKSTLARQLIGERPIARLSLDEIAWDEGPERKPLSESLALLHEFIGQHEHWVIEGCYSDLVEAALPHCSELRFLNPGTDTCIAHCRSRPWEPEKFASPEQQQAMLEYLIDWVGSYASRDDEYGLQRHRQLFERFTGPKVEYISPASNPTPWQLYRIDDNGNEITMQRFSDYSEAEHTRQDFEQRGHKQTYLIKASP